MVTPQLSTSALSAAVFIEEFIVEHRLRALGFAGELFPLNDLQIKNKNRVDHGYQQQSDKCSNALLGIAHPRLGKVGRAPAILKPQSIQQLFHRLFENLRVEELNPKMEAVKRGMDLIIALDFAEQFTAEPKGFLDFFNRSVNATARALTRSQMALSIDLHHYEIVMIKIQFDKAIQLWDMGQMPFILESGRKAIEQRKKDILGAIESFSRLERNASAEFL